MTFLIISFIIVSFIIVGSDVIVAKFKKEKFKQIEEGSHRKAAERALKDLMKDVQTETKVASEVAIDPVLAKYMQKLDPTVTALVNFFKDFMLFNGVGEKLRMHITEQNGNTPSNELATVFLTDLVYVSKKLGHPISMLNKESCGFITLMLRLRADAPCEIDWKRLTAQTMANNEIDLDTIVANLERNHEALKRYGDHFLFPSVFSDFSPDATRRYMRLMYDYSAALANIDGKLTVAEIQWLQFMEKYIGGSLFANAARNIKFSPHEVKYKESGDSGDEIDEAGDAFGATVTAKISGLGDSAKLSAEQCAEEAEKQLNALVGLASVKQEVITFRNFLKIQNERRKKGLSVPPTSYHLVFSGNPGTGKTTIARIMAQILKSLGVISSGHLVEASRSDLVAGYMGQTAIKTNKVIDSALNGVLFIDEAYTLSRSSENDFGQEAIDTLLKRMEDDRDRLVVIIAGYTDEIKNFVGSNPGLASRFNRYINFPDYSENELEEIFKMLVDKYDYMLNDSARVALQQTIAKAVAEKDAEAFEAGTVAGKSSHFGNGRYVRNLFEKTIERQANRLARVEHLGAVNISEIDGKDFA